MPTLNIGQAAQYLTERGSRTSKGTLQMLVTVGGGPQFRKFGHRAVYTADDLEPGGGLLRGLALARAGNYDWMWYADIALAALAVVNLPIWEARVARPAAAA